MFKLIVILSLSQKITETNYFNNSNYCSNYDFILINSTKNIENISFSKNEIVIKNNINYSNIEQINIVKLKIDLFLKYIKDNHLNIIMNIWKLTFIVLIIYIYLYLIYNLFKNLDESINNIY